jgi:hypothetical protein
MHPLAREDDIMKQVTAIYKAREEAQLAIDALVDAGVASDDVSVLVVEGGELHEVAMQHKTLVPEGAAAGSAAGAAVGLALVAVGWLPGLLAVGPALAALQGIAGGAAAGTLVGALAGLGWWKSEADIPREEIESGGILGGAAITEERVGTILDALKSAGARRVDVT